MINHHRNEEHVLFCFHSENFEHMKKTGDYYIVVVEDTSLGQVVATASLIIEHKFIHSCAKVRSCSLDDQHSQPNNMAKRIVLVKDYTSIGLKLVEICSGSQFILYYFWGSWINSFSLNYGVDGVLFDCFQRGRVEEVVVSDVCRGKQLGKLWVLDPRIIFPITTRFNWHNTPWIWRMHHSWMCNMTLWNSFIMSLQCIKMEWKSEEVLSSSTAWLLFKVGNPCSLSLHSRLVSTLTLLSKKLDCYKITLECSPKNVTFYQKFGYSASEDSYMQHRFFNWVF